MSAEDLALVESLTAACGCTPPSGWAELLTSLRAAGYEVAKKRTNAGSDLSAVYKRAQPRIQALFKEKAPPGATPTAEMLKEVQLGVITIMVEELEAAGIPRPAAQAVGTLIASMIKPTVPA